MVTKKPKQMPLCKCGCGERLVWKSYQRYHGIPKVIFGHWLKETKNKLSEAKKGLDGYWLGKERSQKTRKKISETNKGRIFSKETREKISEANKGEKNSFFGKKHSEESRKKMRISAIKYMEQCKKNGLPFFPTIGKNEKYILDELAKQIGYKILRQFSVIGYFLDGYVPHINLAIEVDEPRHKNKTEKDTIRQKEIEQELGCTFLRIKTK